MSFLKDGLSYLGESYWGLPNTKEDQVKILDKGNLYFKWGNEKGELLDYLEAFNSFRGLDLSQESHSIKYDIYEKIFISLAEILKLRLKRAVENFDFLCQQRIKIELRDMNFKKELNNVMVEFMDFEKNYFTALDQAKVELIEEEVDDDYKDIRKNLIEGAEAKMVDVEHGIQAFYHRVKTYVVEDKTAKGKES